MPDGLPCGNDVDSGLLRAVMSILQSAAVCAVSGFPFTQPSAFNLQSARMCLLQACTMASCPALQSQLQPYSSRSSRASEASSLAMVRQQAS